MLYELFRVEKEPRRIFRGFIRELASSVRVDLLEGEVECDRPETVYIWLSVCGGDGWQSDKWIVRGRVDGQVDRGRS